MSGKKIPMVIYHLFAFDHKLLNLKNIIGTKTELYIHLYLFRPHILSACCIPGPILGTEMIRKMTNKPVPALREECELGWTRG